MEFIGTFHNLQDSIRRIEGDERFAFGFKTQSGYHIWKNVIHGVDHIDMDGPKRGYVKWSDYRGPIWNSEISIYLSGDHFTEIGSAVYAFLYDEGLLGYPASTRKYGNCYALKYIFGPEEQPEREDGIEIVPHKINFIIEPPSETDKIGDELSGRLEFGELDDDYKERILFPPPPYRHWSDMPAAQRIIQEAIKQEG